MIDFHTMGRWRPEVFLQVADHLEMDGYVPHFGHLHDVPTVVDALRRAAARIGSARERTINAADQVFGRGWLLGVGEDVVEVREPEQTGIAYGPELDEIEDLMSEYAAVLATALTDAEAAADELYAVIVAARRDPQERARGGSRGPVRRGPRCEAHRRDRWRHAKRLDCEE